MASSGDTFCVRNSLLCLAPLVRHPLLSKSHPQGALRQLLTSSGGKAQGGDGGGPPGRPAPRVTANLQIPGKAISEILLEKSQAPFGKNPKSIWKNSGLPLEKFKQTFGKIPNSFWKNSGFQNSPDVLGRGRIPPQKTDLGKIPDSSWKNSGISPEKICPPPENPGRLATRGRLTRALCRARAGSARASLCAHEQHSRDCHERRAPRAATRELPWNGTDSSSGSPTALRRAKNASRTSRNKQRDGIHLGNRPWSARGPARKPGNLEKHQYQYLMLP